jgi:hypothetical protein
MRLRRRRHLVLLSSSVRSADRCGTAELVRTGRRGRVGRLVRTGWLLTVISVMNVVRVARPRPRPLAAVVLPALCVILRDSLWGLVFLMVFVLYLSALVSTEG